MVGKTKSGKGTKIGAIADRNGRPIADLAYDSDPLDQQLKCREKMELIAPQKKNRVKPKTQDGRALRSLAGVGKLNSRNSLGIQAENFQGMVQLACLMILFRVF